MRLAFLLLFTTLTLSLSAQVKINANATGKHANAINRAKQAKQTAKERRAQAQKLQQQVKARELYQQRYDSIKNSYHLGNSVEILDMDSLTMPEFTEEDSVAVCREILESANFPPEYRELILNSAVFDVDIATENADSLALAEATRVLEDEARKFLPNESGLAEDPMSQFNNPALGLTSLKKPTKPNPNLIKPDQAKILFERIDPEQFQEAQADIQKLKKKYRKLPDTRYPEEGIRRNSLEKVPFKKRLYLGGNLSLQSTDPLIINTNLQLGYWINKKWLGGVGLILREQFGSDSTRSLTGDGHGYSLFTRYDIAKGFFAWGEVEQQINKSFFSSESLPSKQWQSAHMLGVGREFKIGFVQMMSLILYDFNYQRNDLNARPVVFKLGVQFAKKPN